MRDAAGGGAGSHGVVERGRARRQRLEMAGGQGEKREQHPGAHLLGVVERDAACRERPGDGGEAGRAQAAVQRRGSLVEGKGRVTGEARLHGVLLGRAELEEGDPRPVERLPDGGGNGGDRLVGVERAEEVRGREARGCCMALDPPKAALGVRRRLGAGDDGSVRRLVGVREHVEHVGAAAGGEGDGSEPAGHQAGREREAGSEKAHRSHGSPLPRRLSPVTSPPADLRH